jgi:hypothetical protein
MSVLWLILFGSTSSATDVPPLASGNYSPENGTDTYVAENNTDIYVTET